MVALNRFIDDDQAEWGIWKVIFTKKTAPEYGYHFLILKGNRSYRVEELSYNANFSYLYKAIAAAENDVLKRRCQPGVFRKLNDRYGCLSQA